MDLVPPDETLREPAGDSESPGEILRMGAEPNAMTRTPNNYNESQWSAAGQEEDGSVYGLDLKDEEDSELPRVVKVLN